MEGIVWCHVFALPAKCLGKLIVNGSRLISDSSLVTNVPMRLR